MRKTRTIAVVTGTRAEFGLLKPIMTAIANKTAPQRAHKLRLKTIVTGTHLTSRTWTDIRDAGFRIDAKVPMQRRFKTGRPADVAALARGIAGIGKALTRLKPDIVLVLGDRIEALAAACAVSVGGIHLAHIHGGDRAAGVADEAMRHAITKLAHLHFPATAASRERIIKMGERPAAVLNVGSPAADGLHKVIPSPDAPDLLIAQHPIGAKEKDEKRWMAQTLKATAGYSALALAPNSDPGCRGICAALRASRIPVIEHLPRDQFLSLLAGTQAIIGNTSAGLIEAAVLGKPCVNIGPRQAGRETPTNIVNCDYGQRAVRDAIQKALSINPRKITHPYGTGRTGQKIATRLSTIDLDRVPTRKVNTY